MYYGHAIMCCPTPPARMGHSTSSPFFHGAGAGAGARHRHGGTLDQSMGAAMIKFVSLDGAQYLNRLPSRSPYPMPAR